jgi:succinate dehydrogenase/fumarate reductase flavoprotein subunit
VDKLRHANGQYSTAHIRREMQKTMQRHAAVYRVEKTLKEGVDKMYDVYQLYHDVKVTDRGLVWNTDLIETL